MDDGMSYCPHCGSSASGDSGRPYGQQPHYQITISEKNVGLAVILALIIVGAGHMYAGKVMKGIIILVLFVVLSVPAYILFFASLVAFDPNFDVAVAVIVLFFGAYLAVWIWTIYDAMKTAQEYNEVLRRTGTPPW